MTEDMRMKIRSYEETDRIEYYTVLSMYTISAGGILGEQCGDHFILFANDPMNKVTSTCQHSRPAFENLG